MKWLLVVGVLGALALGLYVRATWVSEATLAVGPSTTVIQARSVSDFDAAMQASAASEQRLESLLEVLDQAPDATSDCAPLTGETRARFEALVREPLRMRRPASHITPASQLLATRLLLLLRRLTCSCTKQKAPEGPLLAAVSAFLSSSNEDTFYQLHSLAARAATTCLQAVPARVGELHFYDALEHLELVRLGMLAEIVGRSDRAFDVNAALVAFNDDFMRALDGAELSTPVQPKFSWFESGAANRAAKSAFVGRSFAQQVPEIVGATRTAFENTVRERRAWAGE